MQCTMLDYYKPQDLEIKIKLETEGFGECNNLAECTASIDLFFLEYHAFLSYAII